MLRQLRASQVSRTACNACMFACFGLRRTHTHTHTKSRSMHGYARSRRGDSTRFGRKRFASPGIPPSAQTRSWQITGKRLKRLAAFYFSFFGVDRTCSSSSSLVPPSSESLLLLGGSCSLQACKWRSQVGKHLANHKAQGSIPVSLAVAPLPYSPLPLSDGSFHLHRIQPHDALRIWQRCRPSSLKDRASE